VKQFSLEDAVLILKFALLVNSWKCSRQIINVKLWIHKKIQSWSAVKIYWHGALPGPNIQVTDVPAGVYGRGIKTGYDTILSKHTPLLSISIMANSREEKGDIVFSNLDIV